MSNTHDLSERAAARRALVVDLMQRVRELAAPGVDRVALARIKDELCRLALRQDLFPVQEFAAIEAGSSSMYRLSEDADHRYALYVSCPQQGRSTPPHDHTTWAVIVGVRGREHNRLYRKTSVSADGHTVMVEQVDSFDVVPGSGLALMPEDVHSIHLGDDGPHMNLHLYGVGIEHLHDRSAFDLQTGAVRKFPAASGVKLAEGAL
ncbi:MAG: hypothetical protein J0H09_23095 [Burkholderiales bacterium]|nr:hypothetical protein [Burkholderiales bacterium]